MFENARRLFWAGLVIWCLPAAPDATCGAEPMQFGFSRVDVTPQKALRLSGYGSRSKPSEGVEQRIWARSMAVRIDDGPVHILTAVDTIGFPGALTTKIARRLEKEQGIGRKQFVLCGTHSHATPHLSGGLTNIFTTPLTPKEKAATRHYTDWLTDRVVESVERALGDLNPGRMTYAVGEVGFASNRRVLAGGRWTRFGVNQAGPVDHALPVLKITGPGGQLRGVIFNYACHCTTLGGDFNRVSGDWAGYATEYFEETHPGAVALCTIGCGADANPEPRGNLSMAKAHGRAVALEVVRVIQSEMQAVNEAITSSFGYAGLPVDRPSLGELRKRLDHQTPQYRRHAESMLALHKRMGRLPETYPMPIQTWRFGDDLTMVFLGGEVVIDYAHRLRREIGDANLWVSAYANDVFAYVASERVRQEGGYEVDRSMIYYNQPGPWAEGTEEVVVERVREILSNPEGEGALPPDAALKTFRLAPGFEIEPVATEPLISDPVSIAFGPDGRLWVVEMGDYPRGVDGKGQPGGRIRVLEDADGDGRFDQGTIFLDGLSIPNGVTPWRNGILVSCAPDVFYAEDADADGRADRRTVLFTGFPEANPQHRINGFAYGLDNWVYLGSDTGGNIRSERTGDVVNMSGRDLRIRPDEGLLETVSGRTQYGRSRDDWGNWFGGSNSHPMYHFVISDRYLRRNPYVAAPNPRVELILPSPAPPVFPTSRTVDRFNDLFAANRFTSACSPIVFRDPALGPEIEGAAFVCEPVHNLVHRSLLEPEGVTFAAERHPDEQQSEFLSSTDTWFRPVRVATGPNGALWVVDMYRQVIEHPEWIPEDWQQRLDLRAGHDRGRIYRVYRSGERPGPLPNLAELSDAELVAQLESPNGWRRDTAQQLLVHRASAESVPQLLEMAEKSEFPLARLHALCTLDGMAKLPVSVVQQAVNDPDSRVQRRAIVLAEARIANHPEIGSALLALADHPDIRVRYQLALSLGEWNDPRAGKALGRLAIADLDNPWMQAAVLSSAVPHADEMLTLVAGKSAGSRAWSELMEQLVTTALGGDLEANLVRVLGAICEPDNDVAPWQIAALASFIDAIERHGLSLAKLHERDDRRLRPFLTMALKIVETARDTVSNPNAPLARQCAATRLLGRGNDRRDEDLTQLSGLLKPQTPPALQESAVTALAATRSPQVPALLLADWRSYSPSLQREVLNVLLSRREWTVALLDAIEAGRIPPIAMDAATRSRLLSHKNDAIRDRARRILSSIHDPARQQVVDRYEVALNLSANWIRGADIFNRRCATCHRFRARGQEIGPQLAALQDKSAASLLVAILDPNRAVEQKYRSYVAATVDGRLFDGLVIEESSTSVTLARPTGRRDVLLRNELEEFASTGKSFMPEGLEKDLTPQDAADVIAFLQSGTRLADSREPGSAESARKLLINAGDDGLARLLAVPARREFSSWLGPVTMPVCESNPQAAELRWESTPWTGGDSAKPAVFRLAVAMGKGGFGARFELRVNGKESVQFTPTTEDASWASENSRIQLRYLAVESADDHTSGLLEIELARDLAQTGQPLAFAVDPPESPNGGWFGLLPVEMLGK